MAATALQAASSPGQGDWQCRYRSGNPASVWNQRIKIETGDRDRVSNRYKWRQSTLRVSAID